MGWRISCNDVMYSTEDDDGRRAYRIQFPGMRACLPMQFGRAIDAHRALAVLREKFDIDRWHASVIDDPTKDFCDGEEWMEVRRAVCEVMAW